MADPLGKEGLYAVTLGALREGSTKRSGDDLAKAAAAIGTNVTPTGFTTISSAFAPAIDLMAEMLTRPSIDSIAVERRKAMQSAAARRVAQAPVSLPRRLFYELTYGAEDPFVRSLAPTETSVASITRGDVTRLYDAFFGPRGTTVVVAGDVTDSSAVSTITRAFGAWQPRGAPPAVESLSPELYRETKIAVRDVPGAGTQAYMYVGSNGPSRSAADVVAMEAFSAVASARFQETVREKRSFMYSGAIGMTWKHDVATFVGSAVVNAARADSALADWMTILRELRTTRPPTEDELAAVKRARIGSLPARIDGPDSLAGRVAENARDGIPFDYLERYAASMSALRVADLVAAGARYVNLDRLVIVVTGDQRVLEPVLRAANLAPLVVVGAPRSSVP